MTRTAETEEMYRRKGGAAARAAAAAGVRPSEWMVRRAAHVAHASFRLERVALAFYLREAHELAEARRVDAVPYPMVGRKSRAKRTSATKLKSLSDLRVDKLVAALRGVRSNYAPLAVAMITVGRVTGLRPGEWAGAVREQSFLVVRNAKATNGRAVGEVRTLQLPPGDPEVIKQVDLILGYRDSARGAWTQECREAQRLVRRVARKLWPGTRRWPTLYSARHQYSADMKARFSPVEVAAGMGHASDQTAGFHYAPKRLAREAAALALPTGEVVAKVRSPGPSSGSHKRVSVPSVGVGAKSRGGGNG